MEIFLKLKQWFIQSALKFWLIFGAVIFVLVTSYRETQIENMVSSQFKEITTNIQASKTKMQETKKLIEAKEKEIDSSFDQTSKKDEDNMESSKNSIHEMGDAISAMVDHRWNGVKPIKEPYISEKGPHTIEDVKVMRLALEGTLTKLITLRTDDVLEEYLDLQKQFEKLLVEVFGEKKEIEEKK